MKALIQFCILLVVVVGAAGFYVYVYTSLAGETSSIAALSSQITSKKTTANRASAVKTALEELGNDETLVRAYFISDQDLVSFIEHLESLGKSLGTSVKVLSVGTGKDTTKPTYITSLSIQGSFDAVGRTIGAIEYAPYDVIVTSVTLTSIPQDEQAVWGASMNLSVGAVGTTSAATVTPQNGTLPKSSGIKPATL